jgi:hypothetical protein
MSDLKRAICSKMHCNLFNTIAVFCAAGLSLSLTMAIAYGVTLAEPWL